MHKVLVNRLGGLSLPRKSVVRLTDRPDMILDVYHGRKTTMQQQQQQFFFELKGLMYLFSGTPKKSTGVNVFSALPGCNEYGAYSSS